MSHGSAGGDDRNSQRAVAFIGAGAVVLAAVITGVFALISHGGENSPGGQATGSAPFTAAPSSQAVSPSTNSPSSSPIPPGTPGSARISGVTSASGGSCLGDTVRVTIVVSSPASADRELWLMAIVMTGTPTHPVYYAKQQLVNGTGPQTATIQFIGAAIGSVRNLAIVSSAPASYSWLKQNLANDGNPAWDIKRVKLPGDVPEISSQYKVTRQC